MSRTVLASGIDVSTFQGKVDWAKVKASGKVDFAFIRVGFRGYASGKLEEDKQFAHNIKGASENGIKIGLYFFSTALNEAEAREEAQFILDRIGNYEVTLPIVYDLEGYGKTKYRTYGITKEQRTANLKAFNGRLAEDGYSGLIYGSKAYVRSKFNIDSLDDYIWLACYPSNPNPDNVPSIGTAYDNRVAIWQYSSTGRIDGINAKVDLNYMYIDVTKNNSVCVKPANPYTAPVRTLYCGNLKMSEEDIKWLQWELAEDGYDTAIDGKFTKTTTAILRDYQYNHGLEIDGKCGPATKKHMAAK